MKKFSLLFTLIFFCFPIFKANATDYHGAIAVSNDGSLGWSYDYRSRWAAERIALRKCGRGCRVAVWFKNACGAIAMNRDNSWAANWGNYPRQAQRKALRQCNRHYGSCYIERWVCTTRRR